MRLILVPKSIGSKDIDKIRFTYEDSFPPEERPPFDILLKQKKSTFYGVYEKEEYIGFINLVEHEDLVYLFFLAVKPEKRNKGYGAEVLRMLKEKYEGKRLFLLAEETGNQYEDNAMRIRRQGFYKRNGFETDGTIVIEFEVAYNIFTYHCRVAKDDYRRLLIGLYGQDIFDSFYSKHFR
ncbi:MAG: GNAT family N-acetyltransferase [Bacilli bacterium]|nr:GNAT family N-acetyltransferase [Bacilli bacterium]